MCLDAKLYLSPLFQVIFRSHFKESSFAIEETLCSKDEDDLLQGLSSLAMISTLGYNYS